MRQDDPDPLLQSNERWHRWRARITGQVLVEGRDVYQSENSLEELRKKVGMVFQRSNPFPMSIRRNITFGPQNGRSSAAPHASMRSSIGH